MLFLYRKVFCTQRALAIQLIGDRCKRESVAIFPVCLNRAKGTFAYAMEGCLPSSVADIGGPGSDSETSGTWSGRISRDYNPSNIDMLVNHVTSHVLLF